MMQVISSRLISFVTKSWIFLNAAVAILIFWVRCSFSLLFCNYYLLFCITNIFKCPSCSVCFILCRAIINSSTYSRQISLVRLSSIFHPRLQPFKIFFLCYACVLSIFDCTKIFPNSIKKQNQNLTIYEHTSFKSCCFKIC